MKGSMKRRFLSLWIALLMVLSLTTGISIPSFAADKDIVVLYTNDVHCGVDDNIGYAGLALYKKEMLAQTPYVALVDGGDAIQGAPIGTLSDGGYLIDIMNKVGYDFAVPGNHEFDYGMPRFLELAEKLNCGYYSSNFMDLRTGSAVFAPYKMFTYGNTKVAFVGATTPESFTKSTPTYFQDGNGTYIYGFCEDESGKKLYTQIQASVDHAKAEGAEIVVLVGHLGENGTTDQWTSDNVIKNTAGIDAVIDGHSHEVYNKYVKNKDGKDVLLTQTGTKLKNIGKLTIKTDGTMTSEMVTKVPEGVVTSTYTVKKGDSLSRIAKRELGSYDRYREIYNSNRAVLKDPNVLTVGSQLIIPAKSAVTADGKAIDYDTDRFIKAIQSQYNETLKTVIGRTDTELTINNPATGNRAVRSGETNLGDLCADAYRVVLGADIGLSNGGGVRASIKPGNITYNDTLTVFPFGNMGCVAEVKGQQIKDALEMASKNYPKESGGFLQVSGLTYTINSQTPSSVQVDEKGNFLKVNGAYRVSDIMVGGTPLDVNKTYTVASHNYMLKSGGDGMTMFKGSKIIRDEVITDVDLLSSYIRNQLGGNVGSDYANPAGQGRITTK
ncbi:5'-nucleotidase C-terminal domain-containing protein [Lacrimispora xylanolytica]|uniref:5'-nucleotidase C-terminal domain-containing protein n=1 Tax=Lacrimispora xylanolytica TaxID=29375 RepID=A0ABY7ADN4_9FIRM|nr:5'-nucleotidase C-terminal domain-containing protein [Lacrimispora xylanolytica]WAJ24686.1 5'-nucleotidase C-terminal domain-containing protein [Lacrimispora xylanolytica]